MRDSLALTLALLLGAPGPLAAMDLETLVMPGPLIAGHADIESDCTECHRLFDRKAEDGLCLVCHEGVAADLEAGEGFHGRAPGLVGAPCRSCHTDHRGRDADVVGLNPAIFDHTHTDYPLHGAHRSAPCSSCHAAGEKHREAKSACIDCHRPDDAHQGGLGEACGACHVEEGWKEAKFDHDETEFPLEGAHEAVACRLCHADEKFEGTPTGCATCHVQDDVHRGSFGLHCADCHEVREWKQVHFDHNRDTDFRLTGAHRSTACTACHTGHLFDDPVARNCLGCHRADDVHRGRNGEKCADCHGTQSWKGVNFDHDEETEFPLRGHHADVACESCHPGSLFEEDLGTRCIDCHAEDDVHRGEQGEDCARCHREQDWARTVHFDHDLTRFPLLGLHATVACEECHTSHAYREAEQDCVVCHRGADEHETRLGLDCATCHNPNGWNFWRFDHDAQTRFALHGAHDGLDCTTCHVAKEPASLELPADCASCHFADDVHRGGFGRDCARCHGDEEWKKVRLRR